MTGEEAGGPPVGEPAVLRVVAGDATPEEVAAVVAAISLEAAVLVEAAATPVAGGGWEPRTSVWSDRRRGHGNVRAAFAPGPDGWRTSFWPR